MIFIFIFDLFFLVLPGCFKRWVNNKLKLHESSLLHIFYYILWCTVTANLTKRFDTMWKPLEKSWTSNAKTERWLMSSGRPRAVVKMHIFVSCQTDIVNKQLLAPLGWNNPLLKTKFFTSQKKLYKIFVYMISVW